MYYKRTRQSSDILVAERRYSRGRPPWLPCTAINHFCGRFPMRTIRFFFSVMLCIIAVIVLVSGCGQRKAALEKQKANLRAVWTEAAWNKGNYDGLDNLFSTDYVYHNIPFADIKGLDAYKQFITANRSAYPDINITLEDAIIEGDKVVSTGTYQGTQTGLSPTMGITTGKQVNFKWCVVSRMANGKFVESWAYVDYLGLRQQIGYTMLPPITKTTFARVHIHQFKPEKMEEVFNMYRESFVPVIKSQKGFCGLFGLKNDTTGKSISITLWDNEANATANMQTEDYKSVSKTFADKFKGSITAKIVQEGYVVAVQE